MRKPFALAITGILLLISNVLNAQPKLPFTNNELRQSLEKVISDFPREMNTLKGEMINQNPQTTEYATLLKMEGVEENSITQYVSVKPIYSWQATYLTTESFEEASKKYKWIYSQLKAMTLKMEDGYSFTLSGKWEAPDESKKFCTSTFQMTPAASNLPKLKIEVGMQFLFPEWKVTLTVFQKEREDNERGDHNDQP